MRVEVYHVDRHRDLWEEFVEQRANNAHFMHTRRYIEYHVDRFDDHSLLLMGAKDDLLAVLPAHRVDTTLVSHGGLSFGGLLVGGKFRYRHWREAFLVIGEHMGVTGLSTLDYRLVPWWYHEKPGGEDVFFADLSGSTTVTATAICRMDGKFHGNATRRNEARMGVSVHRNDAALADVMDLVASTLRDRHRAQPVHSHKEIEQLAEKFPDGIRCYTAQSIDEELVAGVVLFCSRTVVKLQYVGYTENRAMSAIFAHLFTQEEFRGRWFDFGTSMAEDQVDEGLLAYKESLGGRLVPVRRYMLDASSPPLRF